jgi:hypothetical protein
LRRRDLSRAQDVPLTGRHGGRLHAKREDSRKRKASTHSELSDRRSDDEAKRGVREEPDREATQ